eukprot:scaffold249448_cov18-Prasinocladus_malaysianus.AAC.1
MADEHPKCSCDDNKNELLDMQRIVCMCHSKKDGPNTHGLTSNANGNQQDGHGNQRRFVFDAAWEYSRPSSCILSSYSNASWRNRKFSSFMCINWKSLIDT